MKKILLIFIILANSIAFAQKQEAILFLKDGTQKEGLALIFRNKIKFKKNKDSEKEMLNHTVVSKILIKEKDHFQEYIYKKVLNKEKSLLLRVVLKGKVHLFLEIKNGGISYDGGSFSTSYDSNSSNGIYFIGKDKDSIVSNAGIGSLYSRGFNKKIASKYFNDCPSLIEKIKNKYFLRYNLKGAVEYYNNDCQNKK